MRQRSATRWALVLIGMLTFAAALFGVLVRLNSEYGFVACTATTQFGWIVPVVGGAVLGLVVLLLLREGEDGPEDSQELRASACRVCGNEVIDEWRLCPHCGHMLRAPSADPVGSSTSPGDAIA